MKVCTVCKENKELAEFHNSKTYKDGKCYRCITCDRKARAQYKDANRDRFREVSRNKRVRHVHGLEPEDYRRMLDSQGGVCAICKTDNVGGRNSLNTHLMHFAIDHCHNSGVIRGLLCNCCNRGIGLLDEDPLVMAEAIKYLTKQTH